MVLFDWERVEVDLFDCFDLAVANETAELCDWDPRGFFVVATGAAAATAAAIAATSTAAEASAEAASITASFSHGCVCLSEKLGF